MLEIEEIQNTKLEFLESQLDRSKKEIEIIQKISNEVNATLDLRRIAETMLRLMFEIFSFEHSMILLLEEDNDTSEIDLQIESEPLPKMLPLPKMKKK